MMTNEKVNRWCVLHTAYRLEHKLMQRLNAAGHTVFCPMQIEFKKWSGKTREVYMPVFSGCLFVEETADVDILAASMQASVMVDKDGRLLSICADKTELIAEFDKLLK